jgi:hypothetical protein
LNDVIFQNGIIEYDIIPQDPFFSSLYFRRQDENETECVYLRVDRLTNPVAMDAIQYAGYNKGVNLWDLLPHYQAPVPDFKINSWNHIKLIVSGKQMVVYVNDRPLPVLEIPRLEGNTEQGGLAFDGAGYIANVVIRPNVLEGLPSREGFDPTYHDPRYLRNWLVSAPQLLPNGQELFSGNLPKPETAWQSVAAERRGLVNLTRIFGKSDSRRVIWLKVKLNVSIAQKRRMSLGFSDEVWVFINKEPLFVDKNIYIAPTMRKVPDGRISIDNASFDLPLKAGENELLIGVANDFYGWGIIARLDSIDGIEPVIP